MQLKKIAAACTLACAAALGAVAPAHAQISGDTIKIGIITDMSGLYSDIDGIAGVEAIRMAVAAPTTMKGFFFSAATLAMASAVPELVPPISMSTPCVSNHSRALAAATSALFWWSA